jgi:hypothetical protein
VPTRKEETGIINTNARTRQRRSAEPCSSDEFRRREAPDATRELELPRPYDFDASLRFLPFGLDDPSCRRGPGTLWQATRTPAGATSFWVRLGESAPRHWLRLSSEDFRRAGIDGQRAGRLRAAARAARAVDACAERDLAAARETLSRIPGCGPWTVGMVAGFALGDPDAVPVGDLHLPSLVANALVGEPRADDARMLELLEPYRGHRFRLIRLLLASDRIRLGRSGRA